MAGADDLSRARRRQAAPPCIHWHARSVWHQSVAREGGLGGHAHRCGAGGADPGATQAACGIPAPPPSVLT